MVEREYMGGSKAKMWTYLILAVVLVLGIGVANFALGNPELARDGVDGPGEEVALASLEVGLAVDRLYADPTRG